MRLRAERGAVRIAFAESRSASVKKKTEALFVARLNTAVTFWPVAAKPPFSTHPAL